MKRGAWGISLLALLTLALAIVITTSSSPPRSRSTPPTHVTPTVTEATPTRAPSRSGTPKPQQTQSSSHVPIALWALMAIPLVLAVGLLGWLLLGGREPRRRKALPPRAFTPSELDALDANLEQRLADVVQAQLADLSGGTPRNAVVASWLALEEAAGDNGFYRKPALTSAEFTEQVLAAYRLDERAIRQLSSLYREARFSAHEMTEQHRQTAANALDTLKVELSARARDRLRAEPAS